MNIPKNKIEWTKVNYLRHENGVNDYYDYSLWLPEPLASWDVFDYWERERIESMRANLTKKDVLFDIGAEVGWLSVVYAKMVGGGNMVLIEPTAEFWPNIKAIWKKNLGKVYPLGCYKGLFSDKTTDQSETISLKWPTASNKDLVDKLKYEYIHEHGRFTPEIKLDDYVQASRIIPSALTIDTEGSELLILKGAKKTLKKYKPKVWVSIHPDLGKRDYAVEPNEVIDYMKKLGYKEEFLAEDHELHYFFK